MINRLLELILILIVNCARAVLSRRPGQRRAPVLPPPEDHLILGHTMAGPGREPQAITLSPEERRRHLYVLGATGTGKTNFLMRLIQSDITDKRSFCVIDLRGDLIDRILLRLAQQESPEAMEQRLLLIDLRRNSHTVGFNPLAGQGDLYGRAFHLLAVLRQQSDSWGIQLEETLRNCLIALAESGWSLLEIEPLLSNASFRRVVLSQVSDSYVRSFFERYDELSPDKQVTWRLPVFNKITPLLAIPQLRLMFGQRTSFSFSQLLDWEPGRIILVSLAVDRLHGAAYLAGGLFVSAFQSAIMSRVDQPEKSRAPVHFYVDEFETMATEHFQSIIAEGRRFGLGLCLSHQNLSQLPLELRHVLLNNVHTQMYFQTGALDAAQLAREISTDEPKDVVRSTLITQAVGEAYLVRRGEPSQRVRIPYSPDPSVDKEKVRAIVEASLQTYGRPRSDVESELKEREQYLRALEGKTELEGETEAASDIAARPENETRPENGVEPETGARPENGARPKARSQFRPGAKPTYEIRHSKDAGQFKPKAP